MGKLGERGCLRRFVWLLALFAIAWPSVAQEREIDGVRARLESQLLLNPRRGALFDRVREGWATGEGLPAFVASLRARAESAPASGEPLVVLGLLYERDGDLAGAVAALDEAVRRSPASHHANGLRGELLVRLRRFADASEALRRALDAGPPVDERRRWTRVLGQALLMTGDAAGAQGAWQQLLQQGAVDREDLRRISGWIEESADGTRALDWLRRAREGSAEPDFRVGATLEIAELLGRLDQVEAGGQELLSILEELSPGSWMRKGALARLETLYRQTGRVRDLLTIFDRWTSEHPDDFDVALRRADMLSRLGNKDGAREALEALLAKAQNRTDVRESLAEILARTGDFEGAEGHLRDLATSGTRGEAAWVRLGEVILRGSHRTPPERERDAVAAWSHLATPEQGARGQAAVATLCARNGLTDAALFHYEAAISLDETDSALVEALGAYLFELGRTTAAVNAWQRLERAPLGRPGDRLRLGEILLARSLFTEAKHALLGACTSGVTGTLGFDVRARYADALLLAGDGARAREAVGELEAFAETPAQRRRVLETRIRVAESLRNAEGEIAALTAARVRTGVAVADDYELLARLSLLMTRLTRSEAQRAAWRERASKELNEALRRDPQGLERLEAAASVLEGLGLWDQRLEILERLIALAPSRTLTLLQQVVDTHVARGDSAAAHRAARRLIAFSPTTPRGYILLGDLLQRAGNSLEALAVLEEGLKHQSTDPALTELIARWSASTGDRAKANVAYRKAFEVAHEPLQKVKLAREWLPHVSHDPVATHDLGSRTLAIAIDTLPRQATEAFAVELSSLADGLAGLQPELAVEIRRRVRHLTMVPALRASAACHVLESVVQSGDTSRVLEELRHFGPFIAGADRRGSMDAYLTMATSLLSLRAQPSWPRGSDRDGKTLLGDILNLVKEPIERRKVRSLFETRGTDPSWDLAVGLPVTAALALWGEPQETAPLSDFLAREFPAGSMNPASEAWEAALLQGVLARGAEIPELGPSVQRWLVQRLGQNSNSSSLLKLRRETLRLGCAGLQGDPKGVTKCADTMVALIHRYALASSAPYVVGEVQPFLDALVVQGCWMEALRCVHALMARARSRSDFELEGLLARTWQARIARAPAIDANLASVVEGRWEASAEDIWSFFFLAECATARSWTEKGLAIVRAKSGRWRHAESALIAGATDLGRAGQGQVARRLLLLALAGEWPSVRRVPSLRGGVGSTLVTGPEGVEPWFQDPEGVEELVQTVDSLPRTSKTRERDVFILELLEAIDTRAPEGSEVGRRAKEALIELGSWVVTDANTGWAHLLLERVEVLRRSGRQEQAFAELWSRLVPSDAARDALPTLHDFFSRPPESPARRSCLALHLLQLAQETGSTASLEESWSRVASWSVFHEPIAFRLLALTALESSSPDAAGSYLRSIADRPFQTSMDPSLPLLAQRASRVGRLKALAARLTHLSTSSALVIRGDEENGSWRALALERALVAGEEELAQKSLSSLLADGHLAPAGRALSRAGKLPEAIALLRKSLMSRVLRGPFQVRRRRRAQGFTRTMSPHINPSGLAPDFSQAERARELFECLRRSGAGGARSDLRGLLLVDVQRERASAAGFSEAPITLAALHLLEGRAEAARSVLDSIRPTDHPAGAEMLLWAAATRADRASLWVLDEAWQRWPDAFAERGSDIVNLHRATGVPLPLHDDRWKACGAPWPSTVPGNSVRPSSTPNPSAQLLSRGQRQDAVRCAHGMAQALLDAEDESAGVLIEWLLDNGDARLAPRWFHRKMAQDPDATFERLVPLLGGSLSIAQLPIPPGAAFSAAKGEPSLVEILIRSAAASGRLPELGAAFEASPSDSSHGTFATGVLVGSVVRGFVPTGSGRTRLRDALIDLAERDVWRFGSVRLCYDFCTTVGRLGLWNRGEISLAPPAFQAAMLFCGVDPLQHADAALGLVRAHLADDHAERAAAAFGEALDSFLRSPLFEASAIASLRAWMEESTKAFLKTGGVAQAIRHVLRAREKEPGRDVVDLLEAALGRLHQGAGSKASPGVALATEVASPDSLRLIWQVHRLLPSTPRPRDRSSSEEIRSIPFGSHEEAERPEGFSVRIESSRDGVRFDEAKVVDIRGEEGHEGLRAAAIVPAFPGRLMWYRVQLVEAGRVMATSPVVMGATGANLLLPTLTPGIKTPWSPAIVGEDFPRAPSPTAVLWQQRVDLTGKRRLLLSGLSEFGGWVFVRRVGTDMPPPFLEAHPEGPPPKSPVFRQVLLSAHSEPSVLSGDTGRMPKDAHSLDVFMWSPTQPQSPPTLIAID